MVDRETRDIISRAVADRTQEIVGFLQELIRIDSETGREGEIQRFIATALEQMGLEVDSWVPDVRDLEKHRGFTPVEGLDFAGRPNVVGILRGDPAARSLLINGHVDTITSEPVEAWTDHPLSGAVRDGRVYGRGASDMKGGLAAMTWALKVLIETGLRPRGTVLLEYVVEEELTGYGTLAAIARGYSADAGICCETSDLHVQPACILRMWFTVEVVGKSASVSTRWEAVDAIQKAYRIIQAIEDLERIRIEDLRHPLFPDNRRAAPCFVGMMEAGTYPSATPSKAVLKGSIGVLPHEDLDEVKSQFRSQIERVAWADPWMRRYPPVISFFKDLGGGAAEIPVDHPIVQTLARSYESVTGSAPTISGRMAGSDTRYLIRYGNTPTVIFGPGVTGQMHAVDEWVPIDNVITATKALALATYEWCR